MLTSVSTYLGFDLNALDKSLTCAALDRDLNPIALVEGGLEDAVAFAAGQENAAGAAVNAPAGVNRGLAREHIKRETPPGRRIRGAELRLAEYELRARGIAVAGTPARAAPAPAWMRTGFALYRRLAELGFEKYPAAEAARPLLETHAHAGYCALIGRAPLPASGLEGRLQRQLVLYERGVKFKDPMDFFEEITRYKLMQGNWPLDLLYRPAQLDALLAAYTAWLAIHKPEKITRAGDAREGQIILPEKELRENY